MNRPGSWRGRSLRHPEEPIFDQGLGFDLETLLDRRGLLKVIGLGGLSVALAACATSSTSAGSSAAATGASSSSGTSASDGTCSTIPEETAGPYPGDGSNGPDVLDQSGIVRRDIRSSFGDFSGTADGVPLSIELTLEDTVACAPLAGAAVYLWHCDRDGRYSLYTVTDRNYLRGVQSADDDGKVRFTSIFPACYSGRWPHIHFEVYPDLASSTDDANTIATSQIALPKDTCDAVYATSGYEQSVTNLSQISLTSDNVFGDDGGVHQLGAMTGSIQDGYSVALSVPVQLS